MMKFKKNQLKKEKKILELTCVNTPNLWPGSWDQDSLIESKQKNDPSQPEINLPNPRPWSWD